MTIRTRTAAVVATAAALALLTPAHAQASTTYILTGSKAQEPTRYRGFPDAVSRDLAAAPKGSRVTMTTYLLDDTAVTNQLIAAHKRGVLVRVAVSRAATKSAQTVRLRNELGSDKRKPSYVFTPRASGFGPTGELHAKLIALSQTGSQRYVSYFGSGNLAYTNIGGSWNEAQRIADNKKIYDGLVAYGLAAVADRNQSDYYRTVSAGPLTLHLMPGGHRQLRTELDRVRPGKGCEIRVNEYMWSGAPSTLSDARKLKSLAAQGCKVYVATNWQTGIKVLASRTALKELVGAKNVQVRNSRIVGGAIVVGTYTHVKGALFKYGGHSVVLSGSQNEKASGPAENADIAAVRRDDTTAYNAYNSFFGRLWSKSAPMLRVPASTSAARTVDGDEVDPPETDNPDAEVTR